jgi:glycosyltransferase involved in cell wall biosynthesis
MKPLFVISCPIDTYSGSGSRSRDLVKSIIELDKYEVKIMPQRWGNTPWNFIEDHVEWLFLKQYILTTPQLPKQPEIWAQVTVPNEFQPIGKYNIGFTAGIETTVCAPEWIDGVNRMDITLVSSNHAKKVFEQSVFEQKDENTNQIIRIIKLEKPVEVLFEGADIEKYYPLETSKVKDIDLSLIKEDFAYLFLGHWLQGDVGEDRKNVGLLVKAFYETFKNKMKKPALILKTSGAGASYMDREDILNKIAQIRASVNSVNVPNVYLLHGDFSDSEISQLYSHPKVKAMVNLTKGEGFGRPLLEFSLVKKPIITTAWSGHTDYLSSEFVSLIPGQLTNVHQTAVVPNMILAESQWFSPDTGMVGHYLKDVFENYKNYTDGAKRQAFRSKTEFSFDKMKEKLGEILDKNVPNFPAQVQIKLPQLKKL